MNTYVLGFQEIDKTKFMLSEAKALTWGNYPGSKGYKCRRVFVLPPKRIKK